MRRERRGPAAVRLVAAVLVALVIVFPLYWMVVVALSSRSELLGSPFRLWPRQLTLENFSAVLASFPVTTWFGNSVAIALTTSVITVAVNLLGGTRSRSCGSAGRTRCSSRRWPR